MNDDITTHRAHLKHEVALGYRLFGSLHWGDDGAGHISGRDPERTDSFWLLGYGVPFAEATPESLVLVGPDGDVIEGDGAINPAAYFIHAPIHAARPDIVSAAHTHTPHGTPFSALVRPIGMVSQEACAFHEHQAVFDGEELDVTDLEVGGRLARALGQRRLLILANHGLLTVGTSPAEAVGWFVLAERAAEVEVKVPGARIISDASAAVVHQSVGPEGYGAVVFDWMVRSRLR